MFYSLCYLFVKNSRIQVHFGVVLKAHKSLSEAKSVLTSTGNKNPMEKQKSQIKKESVQG